MSAATPVPSCLSRGRVLDPVGSAVAGGWLHSYAQTPCVEPSAPEDPGHRWPAGLHATG